MAINIKYKLKDCANGFFSLFHILKKDFLFKFILNPHQKIHKSKLCP